MGLCSGAVEGAASNGFMRENNGYLHQCACDVLDGVMDPLISAIFPKDGAEMKGEYKGMIRKHLSAK